MSTTTHLPTAQDVRRLLEGLLGRTVTVDHGTLMVPGVGRPVSVGVYADDRHWPVGVCCVDLPLGAAASAALGLVPVPVATAAVASGRLEADLAENLDEVLNVLAATLNAPGATHLTLRATHHAGTPVPPDVVVRALVLGRRLDLTVDVAGYGGGRLSLVLAP